MRRSLLICVLSMAAASPAAAATWDSAFAAALPAEAAARAAVDADPDVEHAKAGLEVARANDRRLIAGEHEFVVSGSASDRTVQRDRSYPEFVVDISRAIRLPGKAALDREAGGYEVKAAADLVDDARHQTGILLSDAWYAWIESEGLLTLDLATEAGLREDVAALRRRVELQDAAQLDLEQGEAALAAAATRTAQSRGRAQIARLDLERAFPKLPLPARAPALPDPPALDPPAAAWRDITVRSSHEIAIAEFQARQAEAVAARARLERRPDPTVGVRLFSDFGGREKGGGVYVSTPLGGARRSAAADAEAARAAAARVTLAKVQRDVAALGERNAIGSETSRAAWSSAGDAARASAAAARRAFRGYLLGELDLPATLLASRQHYDAQKAEIAARAEAWRRVTHLRLDAHDLWHDE